MKVNIKVTPGFVEALAHLAEIERHALNGAVSDAVKKLDREFMAEHFDKLCADYHRTEGAGR
jgi:hypothetical protein